MPTTPENQMLQDDRPNRSCLFKNDEYFAYYSGKPPNLHLDKIPHEFMTVLDVGCGLGRTIRAFLEFKKNLEITGIDEDAYAIECLKKEKLFSSVKLINNRFDIKLFNNNHFDIIIAYNSIYHCDKNCMFEIIQQLYDLLNDNGYFLLTVKSTQHNKAVLEGATELEDQNTWIKIRTPDGDIPHHFCSDEEIEQITSIFKEEILREGIKEERIEGVIVQAAGYYLILKK